MKIRIKFTKTGAMIYIGHLDIMRYFQKAIRRAGIDICYTQGFHPHQIMSFAQPLGVGMHSDGEYFDIEVNSTPTTEDAIRMLNEQMTDGIRVVDYRLLKDDERKGMASVEAADYRYTYRGNMLPSSEICNDRILSYLSKDEIIVTKKTKKGEKEMDIRPGILMMNVTQEEEGLTFWLRLSAGSTLNIKPDLVLTGFCNDLGIAFDPYDFERRRLELFLVNTDHYRPLIGVGTIIRQEMA